APVLAEERLQIQAVGQVDVEHQKPGADPHEPEGGRVGRVEPEVLPPLPGAAIVAGGGRGWGHRAHRGWLQLSVRPPGRPLVGQRSWKPGCQLNTWPAFSSAASTSSGDSSRACTDM